MRPLALVAAALIAVTASAQDASPPPPQPAVSGLDGSTFAEWLNTYRAGATARGISPATLDAVLNDLTPSPRVVELDRAQPGDSALGGVPARFDAYLARHLDASLAAGGRAARDRLADRFTAIEAQTGVPASIILGIWGQESVYGRVTGDFDVPRSLATLAWDGRRRVLFTKELDAVLAIVERGLAPRAALRGSWAGAMGQPQFLPSSFLAYAADGDGDGRADIWGSDADVAASIASYLAKHGWQRGLGWGQPVTLPPGFDRERVRNLVRPTTCVKPLEKHSRWIPVAEWKALGVVTAAPLPPDNTLMTLVEPDGPGQGAYLTTGNYRAVLEYNCSNFYALSVALLGDAIEGR